jgi:hypothetical protein
VRRPCRRNPTNSASTFWQTTGQALIKSFNGGNTATALSAWLAASFPNLYAAGGVHNLAGKTNAEVADYFRSLFQLSSTQVQVEVLAVALNVYATTSSLGGYGRPSPMASSSAPRGWGRAPLACAAWARPSAWPMAKC